MKIKQMISNECQAKKRKVKGKWKEKGKKWKKQEASVYLQQQQQKKIASRDISKNIILLPFSFSNVTETERDWCETCIKWLLGDFPALFRLQSYSMYKLSIYLYIIC